jgi:hypothetical protein
MPATLEFIAQGAQMRSESFPAQVAYMERIMDELELFELKRKQKEKVDLLAKAHEVPVLPVLPVLPPVLMDAKDTIITNAKDVIAMEKAFRRTPGVIDSLNSPETPPEGAPGSPAVKKTVVEGVKFDEFDMTPATYVPPRHVPTRREIKNQRRQQGNATPMVFMPAGAEPEREPRYYMGRPPSRIEEAIVIDDEEGSPPPVNRSNNAGEDEEAMEEGECEQSEAEDIPAEPASPRVAAANSPVSGEAKVVLKALGLRPTQQAMVDYVRGSETPFDRMDQFDPDTLYPGNKRVYFTKGCGVTNCKARQEGFSTTMNQWLHYVHFHVPYGFYIRCPVKECKHGRFHYNLSGLIDHLYDHRGEVSDKDLRLASQYLTGEGQIRGVSRQVNLFKNGQYFPPGRVQAPIFHLPSGRDGISAWKYAVRLTAGITQQDVINHFGTVNKLFPAYPNRSDVKDRVTSWFPQPVEGIQVWDVKAELPPFGFDRTDRDGLYIYTNGFCPCEFVHSRK